MGIRQSRPDGAEAASGPDWGSCVPAAQVPERMGASGFDFFTNFGAYQPRTHCMQSAAGGVDWFWVGLLVVLTVGVTAGYSRIFLFLRKAYLAELPEDRNHKLMQLSWIFLWCSICGYLLSALMFVWPAYRLMALAMVALNFWTWRFVWNLGDFGISMKVRRLQRELRETLESRNRELEELVAQRTEELEAAKALAEEANRSKSMFLANISHEIRTPLTAVIGYSELMTESDGLDREKHGAIVRRHGSHLLGLINNILDMSKIEAGELALEMAACSPAELCDDALCAVRQAAAAKGIETRVELGENLPAYIRTDPIRLRQILVNLVSNSVKFTPSGSITVSVDWDEAGGVMSWRVTDTGVGIPAEEIERVFDPFMQCDASLTRRHAGSGLGLYISRSLARSLGGDLIATSTPGLGTTMTASIRPEVVQQPCGLGPAFEPARGSTLHGRVLLVDDSIDNRRLIRRHLERAGARVVEASDGRMAVDTFERARREGVGFGLILMDMQMPEMDGREATRRLRAIGCPCPIVALTAHALADDRAKAFEAGCDDYASKPISAEKLVALCELWLRRGPRTRAA